jgi:hypothetical protein
MGQPSMKRNVNIGEPLTIKFFFKKIILYIRKSEQLLFRILGFGFFIGFWKGLEFVRPELSANKSGELEYWQDRMQAIHNC